MPSASRTIKWLVAPQASTRLIEYRFPAKSTADRLDYSVDFAALCIDRGDTLTTVEVTPSSGITLTGALTSDTVCTIWVEPTTYGGNYSLLFVATTSGGAVANMLVTLPIVGPETGPPSL
jgi:hypothetical protein